VDFGEYESVTRYLKWLWNDMNPPRFPVGREESGNTPPLPYPLPDRKILGDQSQGKEGKNLRPLPFPLLPSYRLGIVGWLYYTPVRSSVILPCDIPFCSRIFFGHCSSFVPHLKFLHFNATVIALDVSAVVFALRTRPRYSLLDKTGTSTSPHFCCLIYITSSRENIHFGSSHSIIP
jgi:hypothetical protein